MAALAQEAENAILSSYVGLCFVLLSIQFLHDILLHCAAAAGPAKLENHEKVLCFPQFRACMRFSREARKKK